MKLQGNVTYLKPKWQIINQRHEQGTTKEDVPGGYKQVSMVQRLSRVRKWSIVPAATLLLAIILNGIVG